MKNTHSTNNALKNQETPELNEFLGFSQKLLEDGTISQDEYDSIFRSNEDNVLGSYLSLFFEIDAGFCSIMIPTILYTSRDDLSQSPSSLMIEYALLSLGATTLRGSLAYWRGRAHGLSRPLSFALVEIVPKIGRLAPILWLPEHREYIIMKLIYRKYKNKNPLPEYIKADIEKYRSKINRLQKIKDTLDSTVERVKQIF